MSIINKYSNPTITNWEVDDSGNKISVQVLNETNTVVDGKVVLMGLPDERYRVYIKNMVEVGINDKIEDSTQYKVDYRSSGIVFFHSDLEGKDITVNRYYSKGLVYYPASRIWTKVDNLGNVTQTLDGLEGEINSIKDIVKTLDENIEQGEAVTGILKGTIQSAISTDKTLKMSVKLAEETQADMNELLPKGQAERDLLKEAVEKGEQTNKTLGESISTATDLSNHLDENVEIGHQIVSDINTGNDKAEDLQKKLAEQVITSAESKEKLDQAVEVSKETQANIDSSIVDGKSTNQTLQSTINSGKNTNQEIVNSINTAIETNKELISNNATGQVNIEQLKKLIAEAVEKDSTLTTTIESGNSINNTLQDVVRRAIESDRTLNISIDEGKALEDRLNGIIEGTDFETILNDLATLKEDKADKTVVESEVSRLEEMIETKSRIYTQKEMPADLKPGDQWHRIID